MSDWADRAEDALLADLADGLMTADEFNTALRDLRAELLEAAQDEGREAVYRVIEGR